MNFWYCIFLSCFVRKCARKIKSNVESVLVIITKIWGCVSSCKWQIFLGVVKTASEYY